MPYVNKLISIHVLTWIISAVVSGIITAFLAKGKDQSPAKWFFIGFIAPFVSIIGISMTEKAPEGQDFRMTDRAYRTMRRWYSVLISFVAFVVYAQTAQPTVPFWDCGEFIACSFSLSVPHPPGAPLFLFIGRLVSLLPLDFLAPIWGLKELTVAHKMNLMSGFFNAVTIGVLFMIVTRATEKFFLKANRASEYAIVLVSGLVGGLLAAFSSTYWSNAVEAEVYGPAMFITCMAIYIAMLWYEKRDKPDSDRYLIFIPFILYLGIAIHLTVMIILPPIFLFIIFSSARMRKDPIFWMTWILLFSVATTFKIFIVMTVIGLAISLFGFIISSSVKKTARSRRAARSFGMSLITLFVCIMAFGNTTYTLIRSAQNPLIDENNPETIESFSSYMDRKQYGQESMWESMFNRKGKWINQLGLHQRMGFWGFFEKQWSSPSISLHGVIPFIVALLGLFIFIPKHKQFWLLLFLTLLICTLGLIIYINFSDGTQGIKLEVRDRDYFFTPGYMFFSVWIGIGIAAIMAFFNKVRRSAKLPSMLTLILCSILTLLPAIPLKANWFTHDRSNNYIPSDYAYNILNSCDENSILFTNGDNDTFPLWFLQVVEGERTDVCIANLSLLNTNWYIKQLKTRTFYNYTGKNASGAAIEGEIEAENKLDLGRKLGARNITLVSAEVARKSNQFGHDFVPIKMTDSQIDMLRAYRKSDGDVVRVQDLMVKHLIDHTSVTVSYDTTGETIDTVYNFDPPIYFAVTVSPDNKLNYAQYLRMEGLAYRLTGKSGERQVEPDIMHNYLFNTYRFRGLTDDDIFKDENSLKLLQNYTTSFMTLALDMRTKGRKQEALEVMQGALDMLPFDWRVTMFAADIFADVDKWDKFDGLFDYALEKDPTNIRLVRLFSDLCYQRGDTNRTIDMIARGREKNPDDETLFKSQLGYLYAFGMTEIFNKNIESWHEKHPDDEQINKYYESIQRAAKTRTPMMTVPGGPSKDEEE